MRQMCALIATCFFLCALTQAQDSPSLGDVARQARQQKQKNAAAAADAPAQGSAVKQTPSEGPNTPAKPATAPKLPKKVITNDEIPSHLVPARPSNPGVQTPQQDYEDDSGKPLADEWRSRIQAAKENIAAMEDEMKSLADSTQYAGGNCVSNCVEWNEAQKQKQDQLEVMKSQVKQQQKQLENMQEMCRKQGFGSSVYDP